MRSKATTIYDKNLDFLKTVDFRSRKIRILWEENGSSTYYHGWDLHKTEEILVLLRYR